MTRVQKFFKILKLELLDLQDDLDSLIVAAEKKYASGQYTDYVLRENTALYRSEINALIDFIHELDEFEKRELSSIDEVVECIRQKLPAKVASWNYPALMTDLLIRKMDKIRGYVDLSS